MGQVLTAFQYATDILFGGGWDKDPELPPVTRGDAEAGLSRAESTSDTGSDKAPAALPSFPRANDA